VDPSVSLDVLENRIISCLHWDLNPQAVHILTTLPWFLHLAVLCIKNKTMFSVYPYFQYTAWFLLVLEIKKTVYFASQVTHLLPKIQHHKSPLTYTEPILCICPTFLFHNVTLLLASSCGTNLNDKQDHSATGTLGSTEMR
jgi:hypothetical protein